MPPHCDALDGPVVEAARAALAAGDADIVLPFVYEAGETEVRRAFEQTLEARRAGGAAQEVADLYFFETVVRVHRAGEGAPYTGLKPAGLDHGPVIPVAERAIGSGSAEELAGVLSDALHEEIRKRFELAMQLKAHAGEGVPRARQYTEAMLGLQVWSHKLYGCIKAAPHESHGAAEGD